MEEKRETEDEKQKTKGYGTTRHGSHLTKTSEGTASSEEVKEAGGKEPHDIK
jgi:hypothetical protein